MSSITRTMFDTIGQRASMVPEDAEAVGWYPDGEFRWSAAEIDRFRGRIPTVAIATVSLDYRRCSVVDRELGALTAEQSRQFVNLRNGFRPGSATVYVDEANLSGVLRACAGQSYWLWLAWWLGRPPNEADLETVRRRLPAGVQLAAWQYDAGITDASAIIEGSWHGRVSE